MALLYNERYNDFIKEDFPLPDGPNKIILHFSTKFSSFIFVVVLLLLFKKTDFLLIIFAVLVEFM